MPRFKIDLKEAVTFESPPKGIYHARISHIKDPETASSGATFVPIGFEVTEGEHAGKTVWKNFMIEGRGAGFLMALLNAALGLDLKPGDSLDFDSDDLDGAEVMINVTEREYPEGSGDMRADIGRIYPAA